eukprot:CAMPEP_0196718912 /NCGR_PEP_ID=MMETSP1091-20130531/1984_1 /TAXON_ID=302021 /ORGANISM="Rhodomonas sp., Strain CCMP768" /LENGTH=62 /DNA_ID=CAMNT_0042059687 /DNA_START=357 /DNA_END=541 /DNA_ORIENTATION=-
MTHVILAFRLAPPCHVDPSWRGQRNKTTKASECDLVRGHDASNAQGNTDALRCKAKGAEMRP